jgi:hypothetical protein
MMRWSLVSVPAAIREPADGIVPQKIMFAEATQFKTAMLHFAYPKQNFSQIRKCHAMKQ